LELNARVFLVFRCRLGIYESARGLEIVSLQRMLV
jgi:hypothetical protein